MRYGRPSSNEGSTGTAGSTIKNEDSAPLACASCGAASSPKGGFCETNSLWF
jgi:hypothetical protein